MKPILTTITLIFLFSSCLDKKIYSDNEIIELPIKLENGDVQFFKEFVPIDLTETSTNSEWDKTQLKTNGIPEEWDNPIVKQIHFDAVQFAYQNYHQGNLSESFYEKLTKSWNIDSNIQKLSKQPIKCFTHIVLAKDEDGKFRYKIDTDNDQDFSDEMEQYPIEEKELESTRKSSQSWLVAETFINDRIQEVNIPMLVLISVQGSVKLYSPQYAKSKFMGKPVYINFAFTDLNGRNQSSIYIGEPVSLDTKNVMQLNQFFKLDGMLFQNLGIDFNQQKLKIKKIPNDSIVSPIYQLEAFLVKPN